MTLENLIGKGLQREMASAEEISRLLAKIAIKLSDSRESIISLDSRFDLAYEALLQIGVKSPPARPGAYLGEHLKGADKTVSRPRRLVFSLLPPRRGKVGMGVKMPSLERNFQPPP